MPSWRAETKDSLDFPPCPRSIEAPSFLQGELAPAEMARFEAHLANCPDCLREVHEAGAVLALLRALPACAGHCDLLPGVLNRLEGMESAVRRAESGRRRPIAVKFTAAAALALLAGGFVVGGFGAGRSPHRNENTDDENRDSPHFSVQAESPAARREAALERGLRWLLGAQEGAGGWSASRWGGQPAYDVGLSGLALLAILNADRGAGPVHQRHEALGRAVAFMKDRQSSDGRFGPLFAGALYNHAIATVAMLEALA